MASTTRVAVVAVFEQPGQAEVAIDELRHAGFSREQISIAAPGEKPHQPDTPSEREEDQAGNAAVAGAVTGGVLGAIAGAAAVATLVPMGPVLLGGVVLGMAAGAALGSFAGPFIAMGLSETSVRKYTADLHAGCTVVVVHTDQAEEAVRVLRAHAPLYIEVGGKRVQPLAA
jgi:hypothetical protein